MTTNTKALRALLDAAAYKAPPTAAWQGDVCRLCGITNGHDADCPVPAAREDLERLEKNADADLSLLREEGKQEGLYEGYASAREQAEYVARAFLRNNRSTEFNEGWNEAVQQIAGAIGDMNPADDRSPGDGGEG